MRGRVATAGTLAGMICLIALYIQYYRFAPSEFVIGWPYLIQAASMPEFMPQAVTIFCAVTLFAFGWVAARWGWAQTWQASLLAGAGAGTLAGCITYAIMGVFWYGLQGQAGVLQNFYNPVAEMDGVLIIVEAIFKTGTLVYSYFLQIVPACMLLSAFGGLASALVDVKDVWGRRPRHSSGWLFRLSAYLLVVCGYLNIIVTIAVLELLWDKTMNSIKELSAQGAHSSLGSEYGYFLYLAYLVGLLFIFLPAGLTWGWILRAWKERGKPKFIALLWLLLTVAGAGYCLFKVGAIIEFVIGSGMFPFVLIVPVVLVVTMLAGMLAGYMAEPLTDEEPHHSASDRLGFLVSYGVLGGAQIVMGSPAMAIPISLITIMNIPHLVSAEVVERSPVSQVAQLFSTQVYLFWVSFAVSAIIGLIAAGVVSYARRAFKVHEAPPKPAPQVDFSTEF